MGNGSKGVCFSPDLCTVTLTGSPFGQCNILSVTVWPVLVILQTHG